MNTKKDGDYTCICNHLKKSNITDITDVIEAPCRAHLVPISPLPFRGHHYHTFGFPCVVPCMF